MKRALKIDPRDNVAVVIDEVKAGNEVSINADVIIAKSDIEMPHKIALKDIKAGEYAIKYGEVFGYATEDISKGDYVHVHNIDSEKMMK